MSINSMASISSSSSFHHDHEKPPGLEIIRALVVSINEFILEFITHVERWHALKLRCASKLNMKRKEFFEFSEHSILSNLYWGIDSIEAAIQAECPEEKARRLCNSERLLQAPALLDEQEVTSGIPNCYLVSCAYFYLSVIKKLQEDELQVALHFLQALSVYPRLIGTEFAPELCQCLFPSLGLPKLQAMSGRKILESDETNGSDAMRLIARRYKHWLMYYQVLLHEETPQRHCGYREVSSSGVEAQFHT